MILMVIIVVYMVLYLYTAVYLPQQHQQHYGWQCCVMKKSMEHAALCNDNLLNVVFVCSSLLAATTICIDFYIANFFFGSPNKMEITASSPQWQLEQVTVDREGQTPFPPASWDCAIHHMKRPDNTGQGPEKGKAG